MIINEIYRYIEFVIESEFNQIFESLKLIYLHLHKVEQKEDKIRELEA